MVIWIYALLYFCYVRNLEFEFSLFGDCLPNILLLHCIEHVRWGLYNLLDYFLCKRTCRVPAPRQGQLYPAKQICPKLGRNILRYRTSTQNRTDANIGL